jgi:hypothetical protein
MFARWEFDVSRVYHNGGANRRWGRLHSWPGARAATYSSRISETKLSAAVSFKRLQSRSNKPGRNDHEPIHISLSRWRGREITRENAGNAAEVGGWLKQLIDEGCVNDVGQPLERTGKLVRGKQKTVTDRPFAESKDIIGGYTLIEARDLSQAVELSKGCPIFEIDGAVEIRPVMKINV